MKRNILLNPGPATTTDTVKNAMVVPDICPREKEFQELMKGIRDDITVIADGDNRYTTVLFACSGTGVMEAVMGSVVPKDATALVISNGDYAHRFALIASHLGIQSVELGFPWGSKIDLKQIEKTLKSSDFGGVFVVHHDTSTGVLNPIEEIGKIAKKYYTPFVVDAISSFAGIPFSIRKCNIDFMISTANKCLQGMPGVSFVVCKKDSLRKTRHNKRSLYLNLWNQYQFLEKYGQMPFTAPVQVMYALRQAINEFKKEGLQGRYFRYRNNHLVLYNGMLDRGFKPFLENNVEHSCLLETFYEPKHPLFDFKTFHDKLYAKGFTIYPGKSVLKKTFRLANIGDLHVDDIKEFLKTVDDVLEEMGVKL